jgi:hypothetical protein
MAHLLKLIDINGNKLLGYPYTLNNNSMSCGDSYKNGKSHKFVGTKTQVEVLLEVIKRFKLPDIVLSDIEETSFVFSSKNLKQQVFTFRLCRYIRSNNLTKILKTTIELNSKNKLAIYHSFVLAHHIQALFEKKAVPMYYVSGMDLVYMCNNCINFSFKTYEEFLKYLNKCEAYSYIFYSEISYDTNIYKFFNPEFGVIECNTDYLINTFKVLLSS